MPSTIQGPGGSITMPSGCNAKLGAWTATPVIETVDTTGFEDNGNHTNEPVAQVWTGSAMGTGQSGNAGPIPQTGLGGTPDFTAYKGTVTLGAKSTTNTYSFAAVITAVPLDRVHNGKMNVMYNFISSGAITPVWS